MSTREYHYCCLLITTQYIEPLTFKHVTGECIIRSIPLQSLSTIIKGYSACHERKDNCVYHSEYSKGLTIVVFY